MQNLINNNMKRYFMYLRKSRKDVELELKGEGETLSRHERILTNLYLSLGIKSEQVDIFREIVSGESIASRPVIQEILQLVEQGTYDGGFVMEVERLARGDTMDQGLVAQTFKYSNTKIITPVKTYDPNNEYDEEYFEFGLFMSRREYKTITRRLHSGIISSVKEGKHVASQAPYGYKKCKLLKDKGYSLEIDEQEANMVKLIFNLYLNGNGLEFICNKLNNLGFKPKRSKEFTKSTITHILTNPVYIGKIKYTDKATIKKVVNGNITRVKNENKNEIYVDGLHEPLIDLDTWNKVQNVRKNNLISRTKVDYTLKNPMSSILKCGLCGRSLSRITYPDRNDVRICCRKCKANVGSNINFVEQRLILALKNLLNTYKIQIQNNDNSDIESLLKANEDSILNYNTNLEKTKLQLNKTYDLLEQEIYTKDIFTERSSLLKQQIKEMTRTIQKLEIEKNDIIKRKNNKEILIPKIEKVIDCYNETNDIKLKNELLKSVLEKVEYLKINPVDKDDFNLKLYPKLDKIQA